MDIALWVEYNIMMGVMWRRQKGDSLASTRLINGYGDAHLLMLMQGVGIAMQRMN